MSQLVRTQIYLPVKLKQTIKSQAKLKNRSFSDTLREYLEVHLAEEQKKKKGNGVASLIKMAEDAKREGVRGPSDISTNHDYYLYGEGSPKWASKRQV